MIEDFNIYYPIMGNSQQELAKKIALEERQQLLAEQQKAVFHSAEKLKINS